MAQVTGKQEHLAGNNPKQQRNDTIGQAIFLDLGRVKTKTYGAPRITAALADEYSIKLNPQTAVKRMTTLGIEGISPRGV